MTLDPVHVEEIGELAGMLEHDVDDAEHDDFAERTWEHFLDPLVRDDRTLLEPLDEQFRGIVTIDDIALEQPAFPTQHGLDAGTLNPATFRNGAVVDVAHAALAREPSDQDLHRHRSIVGAIHHGDRSIYTPEEWESFDDGYSRRKWVKAPTVSRFAEGVVHTLALYHAEGVHVSTHLDEVEDILLLDGPLYPKEVLRWADRHQELREQLRAHPLPRQIVETATDVVHSCHESSIPVVGFVKNPLSNRITRALRDIDGPPAPWFNDAAMFRRVLDPRDAVERPVDHLAFTNWFVSRAGTDTTFAESGPSPLPFEVRGDREDYEVTFMVIFDPRDGIVYRAEAPRGTTADPEARAAIRRLLLREIAAERGPPRAVQKADRLAAINRGQKQALRRVIAERWDTSLDRTYNDRRWGAV